MAQASDYKWIQRWGNMWHSAGYYIQNQQERAAETNAPLSAIYEDYDSNGPTGKWSTIEQVTNPETRYYMQHHYPDDCPKEWQ